MMTTKKSEPNMSPPFPPEESSQCSERTAHEASAFNQEQDPWCGDTSNSAVWQLWLPLSSNMTDIPVEDMTKWAHRPLVDREAEQKKNMARSYGLGTASCYTSRPMRRASRVC
jgi:hypothetical protein